MTGRNRYRVHVARFTIGNVTTAVGSHQVSAEIWTLPDDLWREWRETVKRFYSQRKFQLVATYAFGFWHSKNT